MERSDTWQAAAERVNAVIVLLRSFVELLRDVPALRPFPTLCHKSNAVGATTTVPPPPVLVLLCRLWVLEERCPVLCMTRLEGRGGGGGEAKAQLRAAAIRG